MDLIYTNSNFEDIGVLQGYSLDMAFGVDENNFELKVKKGTDIDIGSLIYFENTEYGGVVDGMKVDTQSNDIVYFGRTWLGIMKGKRYPEQTSNTANGTVVEIITTLLERYGIDYIVPSPTSQIEGTYRITFSENELWYGSMESQFKKLCDLVNGKLVMIHNGRNLVLGIEPFVDYSVSKEFDESQIQFSVERDFRHINHLIVYSQTNEVHLYSDVDGNISRTQTQFGINEVCGDYKSNAQYQPQAIEDGTNYLKEIIRQSSKINVVFNANEDIYGIGDIIGAYEPITKTLVKEKITKKIVRSNGGKLTIECQVGTR